ncbi:hypothetical protein [Aurantiacibacter poecillastricola]|uniref:hypothetical protein n=1 Tax=Aurantiacibacter poecillastricola TaxID=3064385 RepID=UPI00273ED55B|nr:hypothetical protein [Aurantiacibacter sp. 219JJ12-13]MDP5262977.1 hypothetical protein [Aurantiacibacter sp. 219JJ12-13]
MSFWGFVLLIVLASMAFAAWKRSQDAKQGIVRDERGNPVGHTPREAELEREVEELRERVKVLERIATDPSRRTAEEIENLRDD